MIDLVASQPHYRDHLQPLWDALPDQLKGPGDAALVASGRDLAAARRAGYARFAYLEHGIGQSYGTGHPAYPGGGGPRRQVGLFLSPNETAAAADRAASPRARVEVVGDPRLDSLPTRSPHEPPGPVICTSFHWDARVAPEARSAHRHYTAALRDLVDRFFVIGHAHPRGRGQVTPMYARLGIPFVPSFDDVCRRADLYVCDNSSTIYEFASTGRPVVVLNIPAYRRGVEHGLRFWEAAGVGLNVWDPADLVEVVQAGLEDSPAAAADRDRALAIAYGHRSGAGPRAAAAVVDWLAA